MSDTLFQSGQAVSDISHICPHFSEVSLRVFSVVLQLGNFSKHNVRRAKCVPGWLANTWFRWM